MDATPSLVVNISSKESIEFYEHYLIYKGSKILYRDLDGASYLYTRTSHSINFIPLGTSHDYSIGLRAKDVEYSIRFSSKESFDIFAKICAAIDSVIEKYVLINLLIQYGKNGELKVTSLKINPQGITKKKIFGRTETLPWADYYSAQNEKGNTYVYQRQNNAKKYKTFFFCSMSVMNAIVLPRLLGFLFQFKGIISEEMLKELRAREEEFDKPSDVVKIVKLCGICNEAIKSDDQKFCGKCGNKLTT